MAARSSTTPAAMSVTIVNGLTAAVRKRPNYGRVSHLFSSVGVKSDIINDVLDQLREKFGEKTVLGMTVDEIQTQNGPVKLIDDIFIEERDIPFATGLGNASKRPLTPVANGNPTTPGLVGSLFAAGDAGTYYYKVVGLNRYGRSAPLTTAGIVVAQGDETLIPVADGGQNTTAYIVYRSAKNAADASLAKEIFRVARTGATQTIHDTNAYLPGCSDVFGVEMRPDTLSWKQLAPFTRLPLATVDTSIRWMMLLYGALQVKKPRHNFLVVNVGRDPNSPTFSSQLGLDGF